MHKSYWAPGNLSAIYLILITFLASYRISFADCQINLADSLRKELRNSDGTEKARTMLRLSGCYIDSDCRLALSLAKQAYLIAKDQDDADLMANCLVQQGFSYNNLGVYDSAILKLNLALKQQNWPSESGDLGRLYAIMGISNENAGMSDVALRSYQRSLEIYRKGKNYQGVANSYLNIGCLFSRLKRYDEANTYLEKALSESIENNVSASLGSIYNNLGVVCDIRGQKQTAIEYYVKALEIQKSIDNKRGMANIYHNIAMIYNDLKEYNLALDNLEKSMNLKKETGNREGTANSYSLMAEVFLNMRQMAEAEKYSLMALKMAVDGNYLVVEAHGRKQLAGIYYSQKRYEEAASMWQQAIELNDSLYNQSVSRQLSDMQSRYEVRQKEQENQILKQQISLQQARESQQRSYFRFLIFAVVASTTVLILLFILFRMKVLSMRKTKHLFDREYRLKELELAARESDYRLLEIEKQREETRKEYLLQKYKAEEEIRKLELNNLNARIEMKNKELTTLSAGFISKNEILGEMRKALVNLKRQLSVDASDQLNDLISLVNSNLDNDLNWKKFRMSFDETHPGFFDRLSKVVSDLTLNEQKLCAYLFIGLSSNEIAQMLNISLAAVNKSRQRFRKRISLPPEGDILSFLQNL